jgi:hypothetical protein
MASLSNAGCNTLERDVDGRQSKKNYFNLIPLLLPSTQQPKIRPTAQGTFKREISSFLYQPRKFSQYQPSRPACSEFGAKGRKARGNQIGINEMYHSAFAREILSSECGLPRPIRPSDHNAAWSYRASPPHLNITTSTNPLCRTIRSLGNVVLPHESHPPGRPRIPTSTYQDNEHVIFGADLGACGRPGATGGGWGPFLMF